MQIYCAHCGEKLPHSPTVQCTVCHSWTYLNPLPTAGAVIVRGDRFLAIRRANEPFAGLWDIPGGFCEASEHPESAAIREAEEETGLQVFITGLVGIYSDSYDFQGDVRPTINIYYICHVEDPAQVTSQSNEAEDADWFLLANPPQMAFNHQLDVLRDARLALKDHPPVPQVYFERRRRQDD